MSIQRRIENRAYNLLGAIAHCLRLSSFLYLTPLINLQKSGNTNPRILFVCQGNICRSCYAEHKLVSLAKQNNITLTVDSAGLITTPGKAANSTATEIAKARAVDLTSHKTRSTDSLNFKDYDLIFTMEPWQLHAIKKTDQELSNKVLLLGGLSLHAGANLVIKDPFGKSHEIFELCFDQIDCAIETLLKRFSS